MLVIELDLGTTAPQVRHWILCCLIRTVSAIEKSAEKSFRHHKSLLVAHP